MVKWRIERGVVQQTESLVRGFYEVKTKNPSRNFISSIISPKYFSPISQIHGHKKHHIQIEVSLQIRVRKNQLVIDLNAVVIVLLIIIYVIRSECLLKWPVCLCFGPLRFCVHAILSIAHVSVFQGVSCLPVLSWTIKLDVLNLICPEILQYLPINFFTKLCGPPMQLNGTAA